MTGTNEPAKAPIRAAVWPDLAMCSRDFSRQAAPCPVTIHHALTAGPNGITTQPLHIANSLFAAELSPNALEIDLPGHILFPALVNAHDHLHLNNLPPLPQCGVFPNSYAWVEAFQPWFERAEVAGAKEVSKSLRHWQGGLKNLLCGALTVIHHDPWSGEFDDPAFPARILRDYGWCHSLQLGRGPKPAYGPEIRASYFSTPPGAQWFIHLGEGTDPVTSAELAELDAMGCLTERTVIIHAVALTDRDIERVIERRASVVWCPASNMRLLGRTIDRHAVRRLFEAGKLALGSDSRISGTRDLLEELKVAAACSDLIPQELFGLASKSGGAAIGACRAGSLDIGNLADLIIVRDFEDDPHEALLHLSREDIRAVVRHGSPAMADPDFADWFEANGIIPVEIWLDGYRKLIDPAILGPIGAAELEPGLKSCGPTSAVN